MSKKPESKLKHRRDLLHRRDRVLAVLHPPTAAHARIMEKAGCEALFVGTGGVVGAYTGLADVGTATMTECVTIAGWIAESVSIPVIMDGDTGHGGIMAVRRMVRECIRAGIAGIRIDDQPIEGKRKTQSTGVEVVPLNQAIARYRAAVDMKNELDPNFVVMAQCYARDASDGTLEETIARLLAYRDEAGVDWVQFELPHSVETTPWVKQSRSSGAQITPLVERRRGRPPQMHFRMDYTSEDRALDCAIGRSQGCKLVFLLHVLWDLEPAERLEPCCATPISSPATC